MAACIMHTDYDLILIKIFYHCLSVLPVFGFYFFVLCCDLLSSDHSVSALIEFRVRLS